MSCPMLFRTLFNSSVEAVNISTGWTFNTATADALGNLFADDVCVKTGAALRSNHIAPNGGTLVTVDTKLLILFNHSI